MEIKLSQMNQPEKRQINPKGFNGFKLVLALIAHLRLIFIISVVITIAIGASALYYYYSLPYSEIAELNFSLTFEGAYENRYPNGTSFSEEDIISTQVLQQVYDDLRLDAIFPSFNFFKNSISVQRYNPSLAFLTYEFNAKLRNKDLSSSERYEIEREFFRQTGALQAKPQFTLSLIFPVGDKQFISRNISGEILYAIIKVWRIQSQNIYGVTKYNISFIRDPIGEKFLDNTDYFQTTDRLRAVLDILNAEVQELKKLPNTQNIFLDKNGQKYSLMDIEYKIANIRDYLINPLLDLVKNSGVISQNRSSQVYIESNIAGLELKRENLLARKDFLENLLIRKILPSHESIIKINDEISDIDGTLMFYKSMSNYGTDQAPKDISAETIKKIKEGQQKVVIGENEIIALAYEFYDQINKYNLERNDGFYKITSFSTFILKLTKLLFVFQVSLIVWLVMELLLVFGFLVRESYILLVKSHRNDDQEG